MEGRGDGAAFLQTADCVKGGTVSKTTPETEAGKQRVFTTNSTLRPKLGGLCGNCAAVCWSQISEKRDWRNEDCGDQKVERSTTSDAGTSRRRNSLINAWTTVAALPKWETNVKCFRRSVRFSVNAATGKDQEDRRC